MRLFIRTVLCATLLLVPVHPVSGQTSTDPSGHWEGTIQAPNMEIAVEIDVANSAGKFIGTFGNPGEKLRDYPLAEVTVDGRSVRLVLKATVGGTFHAVLSADGQWLSGDFVTATGGFSVPFSLARKGEARIEIPAPAAPIETRE